MTMNCVATVKSKTRPYSSSFYQQDEKKKQPTNREYNKNNGQCALERLCTIIHWALNTFATLLFECAYVCTLFNNTQTDERERASERMITHHHNAHLNMISQCVNTSIYLSLFTHLTWAADFGGVNSITIYRKLINYIN